MKKTPFVFGKLATSPDFTDRENETRVLASNFMMQVNTIINAIGIFKSCFSRRKPIEFSKYIAKI